jgi:hypothetical protein
MKTNTPIPFPGINPTKKQIAANRDWIAANIEDHTRVMEKLKKVAPKIYKDILKRAEKFK